jgi:hypothetical protein
VRASHGNAKTRWTSLEMTGGLRFAVKSIV